MFQVKVIFIGVLVLVVVGCASKDLQSEKKEGLEEKEKYEMKAKIATTKDKLGYIASALEVYRINHGEYPKTLKDMKRRQLKVKPIDAWGNRFFYKVSSDRRSYKLKSAGPDEVFGTKDDIEAR
jgi:hypothetical protein